MAEDSKNSKDEGGLESLVRATFAGIAGFITDMFIPYASFAVRAVGATAYSVIEGLVYGAATKEKKVRNIFSLQTLLNMFSYLGGNYFHYAYRHYFPHFLRYAYY